MTGGASAHRRRRRAQRKFQHSPASAPPHPHRHRAAAAALVLCALAACGKKGPPLPPLYLVPDAVTDVTARRAGDEVRLRFVLPSKNMNGPGPVNLERIEVLAATVAAGAIAPPNREFLTSRFVVGTIPVKPPLQEGQTANPADTRPAPGETTLFAEELNEAKLRPQFTQMPPAAPSAPAAAPSAPATAPPAPSAPAAAPSAAAPQGPAAPFRMSVIRGVAGNGRPGQPSARIQVPLVPPPPPPAGVSVKFTESAVQLAWTPPASEPEPAKPAAFNVYKSGADAPLNAAPVAVPAFERSGVEFGREECFVVRSVAQFGAVLVESAPSAPACVTAADVFPPAAPAGLTAVAGTGAISLIWQANTDPDLGGYLVLRGEAPGDTLQPVTATPVQETTYRDATVKPGVRYVYAVVAVDRAKPPNTSAQSARVEETAR